MIMANNKMLQELNCPERERERNRVHPCGGGGGAWDWNQKGELANLSEVKQVF